MKKSIKFISIVLLVITIVSIFSTNIFAKTPADYIDGATGGFEGFGDATARANVENSARRNSGTNYNSNTNCCSWSCSYNASIYGDEIYDGITRWKSRN